MPAHNDFDLTKWKEIDLNMDSLWVIGERAKGGKRSNFYHGNFIPQIPNHFIQRYTKKGGWVYDPFLGSATTAIECEELERNIIGIDIQKSDYCSRANVKMAYTELVDSIDAKYIFLSYNDEGLMSLDDIREIMSRRGKYGVFEREYQRFKADKTEARNHKKDSVIEYLHYVEIQ